MASWIGAGPWHKRLAAPFLFLTSLISLASRHRRVDIFRHPLFLAYIFLDSLIGFEGHLGSGDWIEPWANDGLQHQWG